MAIEYAEKVARKKEWELPKVVVVVEKYEGNGSHCYQVLGIGLTGEVPVNSNYSAA